MQYHNVFIYLVILKEFSNKGIPGMQYHNIYSDTERSSSLTIGYYKCNITTCLFSDSERSSPLRWYTIDANALPLFGFNGRYCKVSVNL